MIELNSRNAIIEPVFVQTADDTEYQLIRTAQEALNQGNWIVGECASKWVAIYSRGRTDQQFADLIECDSRTKITQCRLVWERFGERQDDFKHITWSHFREAVPWDDAEDCLKWAEEQQATVRQMIVWRKAKRGELDPKKGNPDESVTQSNTFPAVTTDDPKPEGRTIHRSVDEKRKPEPPAQRSSPPPKPPSEASEPPSDPTAVVSMALRKIEELIGFVVAKGSEQERATLLEQLRPVVEQLSPEAPDPKQKPEKVQAALGLANAIVTEWNMIDGAVRCKDVSPKRRRLIAQRMKEPFWRDNWRAAIDKVREIPVVKAGEFKPPIDWFLRAGKVQDLIEGRHDNWNPATKKGAARIRTQPQGEIKYDD